MTVLGLGKNISSLLAQRGLARASEDLSKASTRLSSGMRINSASDDAAGLAVADSLSNQKRLYTTANRNISDGISALTIAGGALESQNEILSRMMELAEQAANGSLSSQQREGLQKEYNQLRDEFGRIAATTKFNGVELLHGSTRGSIDYLNLQVGIEGGSTSRLSISLGDSGEFSGILTRQNLNYTGSDIIGSTDYTVSDLEELFGNGLLQLNDNTYIGIIEDGGYGVYGAYVYTLNSSTGLYDNVANDLISYNSVTGVINPSSVSNALAYGADLRGLRLADTTGQYSPNLGSNTNIDFTRIDTQTYARRTLDTVRARSEELSQLRGRIGASESRLQTAFSVNSALKIGVAQSESQIRDADIAEEAAKLTAAQVRQQVATQVLQSANLQPQLVLSLLQS